MDSSAPSTPTRTTVQGLTRPAVTTVERHAHLAAAAYQMRHAHDSAVVVTTDDQAHRPIGIVTETDIIDAVANGKDLNDSRIDDLVGREPMTVPPGTTVAEAAQLMLSMRIRQLPVVEDGRLLGIIDISDVCRALLDEVPVSR